MTSNLFIPIKFKTTISLEPKEINSKFNDVILNKLKKNLENVCSKHGFIKKDSLKIIKRSCGMFKSQHFNGNIIFNIQCVAEICNPAIGSIIKCKVKAKNLFGILAEGLYDDVIILEIIVPKNTAGIQSDVNIDTLNIGDEIKIEVCGKKFQLFDKNISIIGRVIVDKEENINNVIDVNDDDENIEDPFYDIKNIDDKDPILDDEEEPEINEDEDDEDDEDDDIKDEDELDELEDLDEFDDLPDDIPDDLPDD